MQHDRADTPIGILDSGVGGLTVSRAVLDQLPHEGVLYVGDTAHGPYGPKPIAQVRAHALEVMDHLVEAGVIDPTKVVRSALQNASSIASLLLTTEALVSEIPEEKEEK